MIAFDQLADPDAVEVKIEWRGEAESAIVVRFGKQVRCFLNRCPHAWVPLDWQPAQFLTYERDALLCSMHGARFRFTDGRCTFGPCLGRRLEPIPVEVRDGIVVRTG